jgi:hypothetical protein
VSGVVGQEPDLGEHHGQEDGDRELPPRVADQHEGQPAAGQKRRGDGDAPQVVAATTIQQAGRLDPAHQVGVVAAPLR